MPFIGPGLVLMLRAVFDVSVLEWQRALLLAALGAVARCLESCGGRVVRSASVP
jgi:hypothetical protein